MVNLQIMPEINRSQEWYEDVSSKMVVANIRMAWFALAKLCNDMAAQYDGTISMAFVLLAIDEEGTPVTKIAPRIGMEPNSLSRTIKSLEKNKIIVRRGDKMDQRKVNVFLTDYGKQLREFALRSVFTLEKFLIQDIPADKLKIFFEVMNQVPVAIQKFKEQNLDQPEKIKSESKRVGKR
ncbi:MAG: MarR family winged helix-turn-helix transcriptional regulator [Chitinophagales bacterium]|nr:MarR family winged helix-turn-helix transcriptional regulator [Chitinophagales bacterium]